MITVLLLSALLAGVVVLTPLADRWRIPLPVLLTLFGLLVALLPGSRVIQVQPHLILPVSTLTFTMLAVIIRYTRNSVLDTLNKDYVKTARSKGVAEWKIIWRHVFRNSLGPVLVILTFRLPILVGGSVLVEAIYRWPGLGSAIIAAMFSSDYPVIMTAGMLIAIAILVASFLVDIGKAILDPRVRLS